MKKISYSLPLRTVELDCDERPLSEYEQTLLERYLALHKECDRQYAALEAGRLLFEPFKARNEELKSQMALLQKEFYELREKWQAAPPQSADTLQLMTDEVVSFYNKHLDYDRFFQSFDSDFDATDVLYHVLQQEADKLLDDYDDFSDYMMELYHNYDHYAIDQMRFDEDRDAFCHYLDEIQQAAFFEIPKRRNEQLNIRNHFNDHELAAFYKDCDLFYQWYNDLYEKHSEIHLLTRIEKFRLN